MSQKDPPKENRPNKNALQALYERLIWFATTREIEKEGAAKPPKEKPARAHTEKKQRPR